jgi:catechol 2,3-dioxygenase-like lactoylglutathione lyase family enzyme
MSISDNVSSLRQANLVTTADARVGRPLTPVSVAGVARRTTRRAVVRHGAYYGAAGYYGARAYGNGYYAVFFADPDGIKFEFVYSPGR